VFANYVYFSGCLFFVLFSTQGFKVMCHKEYLKKACLLVNECKWDYIYDPRGVVTTHVVVVNNKSVEKGRSIARFYKTLSECIYDKRVNIRKYPNIMSAEKKVLLKRKLTHSKESLHFEVLLFFK